MSLIKVVGFSADINVEKLYIKETQNKHSLCTVIGKLPISYDESILNNRYSNQNIIVQREDEILFTGYIEEIKFQYLNETHQITLVLNSGTRLLDQKKKSRSFQDLSLTYKDIIVQIAEENDAGSIIDNILSMNIGYPLIQYMETDWEFIKRITSHLHLPLIPYNSLEGSQFYSGMPSKKAVNLEPISYRTGVQTLVRDNRQIREIYCGITTDQNIAIGSPVVVHKQEFVVFEKTCIFDKDIAVFEYVLVSENSCYVDKKYNSKLIGTSLLGTVLHTDQQNIRLHLNIDEDQDINKAYDYLWTPVSGNVFYLMPQAGTTGSLYFADECESSGKIINTIRENGGHEASGFSNVDDRELLTEHGKKLELYAEHVKFDNPPTGNILLSDKDGIVIDSKLMIYIVAMKEVNISSNEILEEEVTEVAEASDEEISPLEITITGKQGVFNYHGEIKAVDLKDGHKEASAEELAEIEKQEEALAQMVANAEEQIKKGNEVKAIDMGGYKESQIIGDNLLSSGSKSYTSLTGENHPKAPQMQGPPTPPTGGGITSTPSAFEVAVNNVDITIDFEAFFNLSQSMVTYVGEAGAKKIHFFSKKVTSYDSASDRANDAPRKEFFNVGVATVIVVVGAVVIVISVTVTGGTLLGAGLMAGGSTMAYMGINDLSNGVNTSAEDYATAITKAVIVALISYGLGKVAAARLPAVCGFKNAFVYSLARGAIGATVGFVESAIADLIMDGEIDWDKALKSGMFQGAIGFMSGALERGLFKGGTCFVAGTLIHTDMGLVAIEDIRPNMLVLSKDMDTGEIEYQPVLSTFSAITEELVVITTENGETITTTLGHPFYETNRGWTKAEELTIHDKFIDRDNEEVSIISVELVEDQAAVYNFQMTKNANYFVGILGLLVHNACTTKYTDAEMDTFAKEYADKVRAGETINWDDIDPPLSDYMKAKVRKTAFNKKYLTDADKALELHHFASDKNRTYTPKMDKLAKKYNLDLDGDWNKAYLPHSGRHTNNYHEYIFTKMTEIDKLANGDTDIFLRLYQENIVIPIVNEPGILYK